MVGSREALPSRRPVVRLVGTAPRRGRLPSSCAPPQWGCTWIIPTRVAFSILSELTRLRASEFVLGGRESNRRSRQGHFAYRSTAMSPTLGEREESRRDLLLSSFVQF